MPDEQHSPPARCASRWRCDLCGLVGQVWEGHEDTTSLANHIRICHKEASRA